MTAFDNIGNQIYTSDSDAFVYQESSGVLINALAPKNHNGRHLGSGTYIGVITIEMNGETSSTIQEKVMIGVKK